MPFFYTEPPTKHCVFSKSHPLWVCVNSMNIDHKCTHVKCNACYKAPLKRTHRRKIKKGNCCHNLLQPFDDTTYYVTPYSDMYVDRALEVRRIVI